MLSNSEKTGHVNERYLSSKQNMIFAPNPFIASHMISRNQGANLDVKNKYLRIQCMKCEEYEHIQAECANTWGDYESEACNKGEDIFNE